MKRLLGTLAVATLVSTSMALAQSTFQAILTGAGESPTNNSAVTGLGTLVLNAAPTQITVDESWSGLSAPASASHIHGPAGVGTNAAVLFAFTGVPAATSGAIPEQVFSITPQEVGYLFSGLLYMNVHDANFPGGEIRGQLSLIPEPGTLALLGLGFGIATWRLRRK